MPPKRRARRQRRARNIIKFPLLYNITVSGAYVSRVETITETFDRSRTWRIVGFNYQILSNGSAFPYQFALYSPLSTTDTAWSSPLNLASTVSRRGYYRNPCTLWYPSDVVSTTPICSLLVDCYSKKSTYDGMCVLTLHIEIGTREQNTSCPTLVPPPASEDASSLASSFSNLVI